jgi:hypothetical protein
LVDLFELQWISGEDLQRLTTEEVKSSEKKWGGSTNSFGKNGEQFAEMVWTLSTHGG